MSYSLQRKDLSLPWKKNYNRPRHHIKKWRHHFADKALYSQRNSENKEQSWKYHAPLFLTILSSSKSSNSMVMAQE